MTGSGNRGKRSNGKGESLWSQRPPWRIKAARSIIEAEEIGPCAFFGMKRGSGRLSGSRKSSHEMAVNGILGMGAYSSRPAS